MRFRTGLLLGLLVMLVSCGYHVPGQESPWRGQDGKTLYVSLFENRTAEPYLDNHVTALVSRQLTLARQLELTEDRRSADLVLEGVVTRFDAGALTYGHDDRIVDYQVTLEIQVRLINWRTQDILWQEALSRSETYAATRDKNRQLDAQAMAGRLAAARLAEDLHARLLDAF